MDCPSCGQPPAGGRADDVTHNTSGANCYISTRAFLRQLEAAVKGAWSKRHGAYTQATVLLLSWQESDMRYADQEIARLQSVLEDLYHYTVENWKIPSVKPTPATTRKYLQFADDYGAPGSLLIVYYAGHARATSGQTPIWHSRADGGPELDSMAILSQLATPEDGGDDAPDILLIQDCCHPLSAYRSHGKTSSAVVECLYSGGFESKVPIAGPESFTAGLTQELAQAVKSKTPIRVTELHSQLIQRFEAKQSLVVFDNRNKVRMRGDEVVMTKQDKITPSHIFLTQARPPRSIILSPLPAGSLPQDNPVPSEDSGTSSDTFFSWPKAMIAVRLAEDENAVEEVKQWLLAAPRGAVEFEGIIPSFSSILLVATPVVIWDLLPPCSAVSFLGFIRGPEDAKPTAQSPGVRYAIPVLGHNSIQATPKPQKDMSLGNVEGLPDTKERSKKRLNSVTSGRRLRDKSLAKLTKHRQSDLVNLLDLVDATWPVIYREWKSQDRSEASNAQNVLFDIFYRSFLDEPENDMKEIEEQMAAHKDIIRRVLSAYELIEEKDGAVDIRRRLINRMQPYGEVPVTGGPHQWPSLPKRKVNGRGYYDTRDPLEGRILSSPPKRQGNDHMLPGRPLPKRKDDDHRSTRYFPASGDYYGDSLEGAIPPFQLKRQVNDSILPSRLLPKRQVDDSILPGKSLPKRKDDDSILPGKSLPKRKDDDHGFTQYFEPGDYRDPLEEGIAPSDLQEQVNKPGPQQREWSI